MVFTASQCADPGLSRNCATVDVANEMSGRVPLSAYPADPTASRYGTFLILAISSSFVGDWVFVSGMAGFIGTDDGFRSPKLKRARIASIYACCDSTMVPASQSRSILIPSNHLQGPRSVILYFLLISFL